MQDHVTPLKVRGYMVSENTLLAKHMMLLRNSTQNSHTGGMHAHNTGIERYLREHDTTVKYYFFRKI